jgi:hypothetical protein
MMAGPHGLPCVYAVRVALCVQGVGGVGIGELSIEELAQARKPRPAEENMSAGQAERSLDTSFEGGRLAQRKPWWNEHRRQQGKQERAISPVVRRRNPVLPSLAQVARSIYARRSRFGDRFRSKHVLIAWA